MRSQSLLVDGLKASAALVIVGHHVSAYAPFAQDQRAVLSFFIEWLYDYGRMAVSIFLVLGGFLAMQSIAGKAGQFGFRLIWQRYRRLMPLYLVALVITTLCVALARPVFQAGWLPDSPTVGQVIAHVLLAQDWLGISALTAGAWYIAIDFQLYSLTVICFLLCQRAGLGPLYFAAILFVLAAASMFMFNRNTALDWAAIYFVGAYGLGIFAALAPQQRAYAFAFAALVVLSFAALAIEFRPRLLLATLTAVGLALVSFGPARVKRAGLIEVLSHSSYAIFLLHFSVIVVLSALWAHSGLQQPVAAILFVLATLVISVLVGVVAHRVIEQKL